MSRLSECLPQHREALEASGIDTDRLVARAIELRELDGLDPQIAAMTAVEEMLNQQDATLGELVGDLRERGAQLDDEGRELFQDAAPQPPETRYDGQTADGDHPYRVSTRQPAGRDATEDPVAERLVIGVEQFALLPDKQKAKVAEHLKSIPGFRTRKRNPDAVMNDFVSHVEETLLWLFDQLEPNIRERSSRWYDGARALTTRWSERFDVPDYVVAGVFAALSPQKDWFTNVSLAERVLDIHLNVGLGSGDANGVFGTDAMRDYVEWKYAVEPFEHEKYGTQKLPREGQKGYRTPERRQEELDKQRAIFERPYHELETMERAMWVRAYDEAHHDAGFRGLTPEGDFFGEAEGRKQWGSFAEISKAIRMLEQPDYGSISESLGNQHKVRNFFNNIVAPNNPHGDITADTHAVGAGLLLAVSSTSPEVLFNFSGIGNKATGVQGSYGLYAEAYRRAASQRGILARQMQSITWEAVRTLFDQNWKTAANTAGVREIWDNANVTTQAGRDRAREEILQFAGGIPAPEWVSSDDAGNNRPDPSRDSSYLGELGDDAASAGRVSGTSRGVGRGAGRALGAGPRGRGTGRRRSGTVSLFQAGVSEERGAPRLPELESRSPGGNLVAQRAAAEYMASVGRPYQPQAEYVRVDIERAERIAAAYEAMAHAPNDPAVQAAYRALIDQTVAQYQFVKATGIKLEAITEDMADPYPEGPRQVLLDIRDNNHMWFYPTDLGFGSDAAFDPADNMLMELTDEFIDGKQLRANDVFRIVHDYFGHSVEGALFRGRGEENAWQSHIRLYFDEAVGAATSETRGQNSWLNYGPYGETNRTARTEDTVFADQKMGLMPEWTWTEGVAPAAPEQPTELNQPARGRIELPAGTLGTGPATIELLENADLSTFLHESGHFFLEAYRHLIESGQANERVRNDWQSILRWLGVEHGDQIATEHHEQWARAFEAYLLEGKAPSPELQVAFARFRAWLVRIYRSITNLDVELTDEVRGVMDRMLATEQEIHAVEDQMAYRDLFSEDERAGMSNRDKEAYRRLVAQANDEAKSRLEKKLFEEMRREESRWWRDEVEKVLEEVEADVNAQPIYQAWHFLSRGEALVGELPDEVVRDGPFKLSKEAIIDGWGKDALERMPGRGRFGVYQAKGGVHPDVAADLFGLSSGDELVQALIAAPSRETVIKAQAQSLMRERHGEMMSDGTMREAALDAVHSDARVRLLERELQVLSKRSGGTPTPRQTAQALAEQTIAAKPVRDAQRANAYAQAEARAGRLAERALLKGDVAEAARQKRNQLIQHHLFRAARRANDEVEMFQRRVTRLGRAGTRKNIAASYLEQIDGILEQYDFKRVSDRAIAERQALAQFVAERLDAGDEVTIPDHVLHRAQRQHFSTLSVEEFRGVRDAIVNLEHLGRLKNKLQLNKERRDFEAVVNELVAGVDPRLPRTEVVPDFTPTWRKRFGKGAREFFAWHMKLEFMFEALDGDVAGGAWWRHMFKPLADAEVREQEMMARVNGELGALFDRYSRSERARWARKIQTNIGEFNKSSLLALALNWGNQENIDAVIDGYGWDHNAVFDTLNQHLDQRDWEFVQGVWDVVDSLWPDIKALQERLSGVAPTKVQATPIDTRFGSFAGGYYPLKYDSELSWVAFKRDRKAETEELFGSEYLRPSTRQGHTKERVGSGGQPVLLDLSVLTNHITNVVHDLTHREALVYVDKLASDSSVRGAVEQTMGRGAYRQIRPWLASIASDRTDPSDRLEHVLGYARAGATITNMGLKLTTAIVQPLGYLQSVEVIGEKWAWRGLSQFFAAPRQMKQRIDFVLERSTMMRNRQKTFDRDVRDQLRKIKKGRLYEVQQSYFALIGLLDMAVSVPTWLGAYERGLHDFHGDEQKAVDYADRSVRMSQSAGGAKDLAQIQQGSNYRRIFVMFYSYFSVLHNLLRSRLRQTRGVRDIPRLATSFIYLIALPSVLAELITSRGPEDEEDYPLWLAQTIGGYPLTTIVGVRDLANYVLRPEYGYGPSPAFDAVESAGSALLGLGKVAIGEKDWDKKVSKDVAMTLGYWGHLPARQAWVTGEYLYDWANGDIESFSPWELLVTGTRGDERE